MRKARCGNRKNRLVTGQRSGRKEGEKGYGEGGEREEGIRKRVHTGEETPKGD